MIRPLLAVAAATALLAGGVALAQAPTPPADAPPPMERGGMEHGGMDHGRMEGPMGGRHGPPDRMRAMMEAMHPSKAASFHLRKGDARVDIKCADDEPTKACIDAASALLDKLATQPK